MAGWVVDQILHFEPGDFVESGLAHFGFHARNGRYYAIDHQRHVVGLVRDDQGVEWTVAARPVLPGVPNIEAGLEFPIFADTLPDGSLLVSNFGNACLYRIDPIAMSAMLLVDGRTLGFADMGNCVVDDEGCCWVNEVTGCRVWRFDETGRPVETLGAGVAGFQRSDVGFDTVAFDRIYDLRRGPDGCIYVLDSGNFALRVIDPVRRVVTTLAGTGRAGYTGDGGDARDATFGSDPTARFDGPISLSVDARGNAYVGDRFNHVVRAIERETGIITTIAGDAGADSNRANDPAERDPARLNLPLISSMDYDNDRLFVPTDLADDSGDLVVLRRSEPS
ncbi:MAG: hypothetical protein ACXVQ3_04805 [Gaiellaceae bacterium]